MDIPPGELPPPTPTTTPKKTKHLLFGLLIGAALVAIGGALAIFLLNSGSEESEIRGDTTITPSPTPTPTPTDEPPSTTSDWKTYSNSELGFSLQYPTEMTLTTSNPPQEFGKPGLSAIRLSFIGPNQPQGTELADGINISLGVFNKPGGVDLITMAEDFSKIDPEVSSKTPLKPVTVNGLSGYMTTVSGLGTMDHYFLPFGTDTEKMLWVTKISNSNTDEKKMSYDDDFEMILKSLKFD
jgi:hypothetical protein